MLDFKPHHYEETCTGYYDGFDDKLKPGINYNTCPRSWTTQTYPWQESDCDQKRVGPPRHTSSAQSQTAKKQSS